MRYTFAEAEKITGETILFADGEFLFWLRSVWLVMTEEGLDFCESRSDHIRFYSMLYGICKIYRRFMDKIQDTDFDDDPELGIDYARLCDAEDEEEQEICRTYLESIICDDANMSLIFRLLSKRMNASRVFASLYYAWNYAAYSLEDYETDDYYYGDIDDPEELRSAMLDNDDYETRKEYASYSDTEIMDEIMNDTAVDKCIAYEWIAGRMRYTF